MTDIVFSRTSAALARFAEELPDAQPQLVVAGGVAANKAIGAALQRAADTQNARLVIPRRSCAPTMAP